MPGKDAFSDLPKRRPPNLPGYEEDYAEYQRRRQPGAPSAADGGAGKKPPSKAGAPSPKTEGGNKPGAEKPSATKKSSGVQKPSGAKSKSRRAKRPVSPAKRRRNRRLAAILAIIVLIGAGVGVCFGFLFKIESYTIQGESPYTKEEIVEAFHPREGDNMFGFSAADEARAVEQALPYLETVKIRRRLPSNVVLQVTQAEEKYSLSHDGQTAVLSGTRKVLRLADAAPEGLTEIRGLQDAVVKPGFPLSANEDAAADSLPGAKPESGSASAPESDGAGENSDASGVSSPAESGSSPESGSSAKADLAADSAPPAAGTDRLELLDILLGSIAASGLTDITWVDVGDPLDLRFRWENRITVRLGPKGDIGEKMKFAVVLLTDPERGEISQSDKGTLDVSTYPATTDKVWLTPE